jgi:acetyl esterase
MKTKNTIGEERIFRRRDGGEVSVLFYPSRKPASPLLVDIHGGGFVSEHHYSDDRLCSFLNNRLDINVASIEYRYVPKVSYPDSTYDCFDAVRGLIDDTDINFNRNRIFLMGHSAGANIAAGLSILLGKSINIRGQILNYPFLDAYIDPETRPRHRYSIPPFNIKFLNNKYFPDKDSRKDPVASPVYMTTEQAKNIPDSIVISCSMDSLRQDAERYVSVLKEAGVFVEHIEYEDAVHGFIEMVAAEKINRVWWLGKTLINKQKDLYANSIDRICDFITERL